ncbi:MAG: hypothetical protein Q8R76_13090 [Candidatus Omnitrophota bacterium]|nr:hypothetical protein [Candidatus Omnitrophota bacterium]
MISKVNNYNKKNQNKQHESMLFNNIPIQEQVEGGIVRIVSKSPLTPEIRTMQESHNANHALYYLSLMTYAITYGMRRDWSNQSKAERIVAHLSSLSEFICEEEIQLKETIENLIGLLTETTFATADDWGIFLYENWSLFETLSHKYSHDSNSFSDNKHEKLGDVIFGRKCAKIWWWKARTGKLGMRLKKFINEVTK